mmetsp:Transcript_18269/g.30864  ORF Transcript_18269/g.30864 Transcript_18269/m.30864 type:complete len:239 (+) Transcript_18269:130-846(+)
MNRCANSLHRRLSSCCITCRFASSSSSSSYCPFKVLGLKSPWRNNSNNHPMSLSATTSYKEVQLAFRQLALRHHPDTAGSQQHGYGDETDHNSAMVSSSFTDIREAFEAIIEGPNGEAILRKNNDYTSSFNNQNAQYRDNDEEKYNNNDNKRPQPHDSDLFHSSLDLDPQILREVAQVAEEMNPAGLDKGGMWAYANMVNRMAKRDGLPPLRVGNGGEGVVDEDKSKSGVSRRRRKRR